MAISEQVDAGALIAEAIDGYYARRGNLVLTERYYQWLAVKIEEWKSGSTLQETADKSALQGPDREDYRRGYKNGWAHAHRNPGQPGNAPAGETQTYAKGYADGHGGSQKAQNYLANHAQVVGGQGDLDPNDHAISAYGIIGDDHMGDLYNHGQSIKDHHDAQDYEKRMGQWMSPGRGGIPLVTRHVAQAIEKFNKTAHFPDDHDHNRKDEEHPADLKDLLLRRLKGAAGHEKKGRGPGGGGGEDGQDGRPAEPGEGDRGLEDAQAGEGQAESIKKLAADAWHPDDHAAHVAEHGHHPLEAHETLHSATGAAIAHWMQRMHKDLHLASLHSEGKVSESDLPEDGLHRNGIMNLADQLRRAKDKVWKNPNQLGSDGQPATWKFDPERYLTHVTEHSKGAFSSRSRMDAIKDQLPDYRFRTTKERQAGAEAHFAEPVYHTLGKLIKGLQAVRPNYGKKTHNMVGVSQLHASGKKAIKGWGKGYTKEMRAQKAAQKLAQQQAAAAEQGSEAVFSVVGNWLQENVQVSQDQVAAIMEEIYSRVQATYGHLFEVELS